jgi:hypothetical protein
MLSQMHGRDNDGRPMKIDWTDNKEVTSGLINQYLKASCTSSLRPHTPVWEGLAVEDRLDR